MDKDTPTELQHCKLCGAVLIPVPLPTGGVAMWCENSRCEAHHQAIQEIDDELDEEIETR